MFFKWGTYEQFHIFAICLLYQTLCGNEGSKWIQADLDDPRKRPLKMSPMPKVFWVFVTPTETRDLIFPWTKALERTEPPPDKITGWVTLDWDTWLGSNPMVE